MTIFDDYRAREAASRLEWGTARADLRKRADEILSALPGCLSSEIPEGIRGWPRDFVMGLLLTALESRHSRAQQSIEALAERSGGAIDRIQAGEGEPDDIRKMVAEARTKLSADNADERAAVQQRAEALARYVSGHMRLPFRPRSKQRLTRLVARHLAAVLDAPLPDTLRLEERLGRLELGCADELDGARLPPERPGKPSAA